MEAKLAKIIQKNKSLVCVGLDPDLAKLPSSLPKDETGVLIFCQRIIEATADKVCAYKPNLAFFESLGSAGISILKNLLAYIPQDICTIVDGKRGDIGNTARHYARFIFEYLDADATTLNPYMGYDSLQPFLEYKHKFSFVLCLTSNQGAADFQKLPLNNEATFLYELVAKKMQTHYQQKAPNVGLVVGATNPSVEIKRIRTLCPQMPFLIPGIGSQGGDLQKCLQYGLPQEEPHKVIINASRSILYASSDKEYAQAASQACAQLQKAIQTL